MKYMSYGLEITLKELDRILERARMASEDQGMIPSIVIEYGGRPEIKQFSYSADALPINYTQDVR